MFREAVTATRNGNVIDSTHTYTHICVAYKRIFTPNRNKGKTKMI